ncbi:hypothetical protein GA0070606_4488 [Micromonospora citrea]|uniref:Uncharacterized protein n=1 Tax=Micromonospora citrea TaxID=47855 RepID=A0A1C6VLN3_9ACTN|nr:hypothetical protein [Micromonospora citrea]SCL67147.1 hypothetical protein GA0070606_4488 [Micromonospora citrea]
MVTVANPLVHWLLRLAARRWPAEQRADLMREWSAEIATIARDATIRPVARHWRMLAFSGSLAATPGPVPYAPFGVKRIVVVVAALSAYLLGLTLVQRAWYGVYQVRAEGDRPIVDDGGLAARLLVGAVALAPVVVAALAGWLVGRRSAPAVRPMSLGLCLIAVVAAWVGVGFMLDAVGGGYTVPTMGYHFGSQPAGMVASWVVWLLCFAAVAGLLRGAARRRLLLGFLGAVTVAAVAVTAGTFVQFDSATAPRTEAWKWFAQWLVPSHPFETAFDAGGDSFHSARGVIFFVSSYPHVLLAVAAFGVAFLLAGRRAGHRVGVDGAEPDTQPA